MYTADKHGLTKFNEGVLSHIDWALLLDRRTNIMKFTCLLLYPKNLTQHLIRNTFPEAS